MMPRLFKLSVLLPVISTLIIAACSPLAPLRPVPPTFQTAPLTDAEQIAGDTMAYLMEVVLGRAGARPGPPGDSIFPWTSTWFPNACTVRCPCVRN